MSSGVRRAAPLSSWHAPSRRRRDPARGQPAAAAGAGRRDLSAHLCRPTLQHRPHPQARDPGDGRRPRRRARRLRRSRLSEPAPGRVLLSRLVRRLSRLSRASTRGGPPRAHGVRDALLPRRLPGGALLQAPARRAVRPRVLPERDHLGVRLRRPGDAALAGEARHDPRLRQGSAALPLRRERGRPRALPGAGPRHGREGGARQAPDRRLVAHDRADQRPREDGLPDPEAGGNRAPDAAGVDAAGGLVPRLLRRQRHPRRGGCEARTAATS